EQLVADVLVLPLAQAHRLPVVPLFYPLRLGPRRLRRPGEKLLRQIRMEPGCNAKTGAASGIFGHLAGAARIFMLQGKCKSRLELRHFLTSTGITSYPPSVSRDCIRLDAARCRHWRNELAVVPIKKPFAIRESRLNASSITSNVF